MAQILLGLGSNHQAEARLTNALNRLEQELDQLTPSDWFESHALRGGANYLNLVASASTDLSIDELRKLLHQIEDEQGRTRGDEDRRCAKVRRARFVAVEALSQRSCAPSGWVQTSAARCTPALSASGNRAIGPGRSKRS